MTLHERSLSRQAGPFCSGKERKRSFRSDEAKAEEPERTLFLLGAERSCLPSQCRPILSLPSAARKLQHFYEPSNGTFLCCFETAQKVPLQAASIKAALLNVSQASTAHEQSLRSHRCVALELFLIDKCAQEAALRKQIRSKLFELSNI